MAEQTNGDLAHTNGDKPPDHRLGIPYKMTPQRLNKYIKALRAGVGKAKAAQSVSIDRRTIDREIAKGGEFAARVEDAQLEATDHVESALHTAAVGGDAAAMKHWLHYKRPDDWADKPKGWEPPGSSPENPVYIAPGQIDWDNVPDHLAERFLALNAELKALQPASGGLVVEAEYREVKNDEPAEQSG